MTERTVDGPPGDPHDTPPPAEDVAALRTEAQGEMRDLAEHWDERVAAYEMVYRMVAPGR